MKQEYLKSILDYDPETGIFVWIVKPCKKIRIGAIAGTVKPNKRGIGVTIDYKTYSAHRLAWLWMTGSWPENIIDHKDGCPKNNKWNNLRLATSNQNQWNSKTPKNNTSGYKGVCWDKERNKWIVHIRINIKRKYIGRFDDIKEAASAYNEAAIKYFGEFARLNNI